MYPREGRQIPKKVRAYLQIRISAKAIALLDDLQKHFSAPDPASVLEKIIEDRWIQEKGTDVWNGSVKE